MCSFLPVFLCSFVRLASVRIWPSFTLTVHINALYNESLHGREEHATLVNTIPLKIATLLNLQSLKQAYPFWTDVLIVSATSRHYSVLSARRFSVASMGSRRHDSHPSLLRLHTR